MMTRFNSNAYSGLHDLKTMLQLVRESWRLKGPSSRYHIGDVCWGLNVPRRESGPDGSRHDVRLWWENPRQPIGFVWYDTDGSGDVLIHPRFQDSDVRHEMLDWLEFQAQESGRDQLETGGYDDPSWESILRQRGYRRGPRHSDMPHFYISLDDLPKSDPPRGFVVRSVDNESEALKRSLVTRAAFSSPTASPDETGPVSRRSVDPPELTQAEVERRRRSYLNVMRLSEYRRALDIVAIDHNDRFVAFCICWIDLENGVGEFEPVGCDPNFRRRGLTRAVILEGMHRLRAAGAESAVVYTAEGNHAAKRLYESCGFRRVFTDRTYVKKLGRVESD